MVLEKIDSIQRPGGEGAQPDGLTKRKKGPRGVKDRERSRSSQKLRSLRKRTGQRQNYFHDLFLSVT